MKISIFTLILLILSSTYSFPFDDNEFYKVFITSTRGNITRKKLTFPKKNVGLVDITFSYVENVEPDSFCGLPNLETLVLNGNDHFPKIEKKLLECTPNITTITLDADQRANQELDRDAFTNLKMLKFLRINDVDIGRIGKDMFVGLENLELLNLVSCKINEIESDSFGVLTKLRGLHLGHNFIKSFHVGTFANLKNIKELELNRNEISEFDWEQWDRLPSLVSLDLADNPLIKIDISKVPEYFPNIRFINLGNSFEESIKIKIIEDSRKLNITRVRFINYYG